MYACALCVYIIIAISYHITKNSGLSLIERYSCTMFLSSIGYSKSYSDDLYYGKKYYKIPSNVASIQSEIMRNGPITVGFKVYEDFYHYRSGENGLYYNYICYYSYITVHVASSASC